MKKEFQIFGPIKRVRVVVDEKTGLSKCYAFIEYEKHKDFESISLSQLIVLVALDRGKGRRVDGRRVEVDQERGRVKHDWLPRRLGGGRGDTRRNRDEERMVRELKRSHPFLKEKSRSRERSQERKKNDLKMEN